MELHGLFHVLMGEPTAFYFEVVFEIFLLFKREMEET